MLARTSHPGIRAKLAFSDAAINARVKEPMDTITRELATFATAVDGTRLANDVTDEVTRRIVDAVGCALVGVDGESVHALHRLAPDRQVAGGCRLWGTPWRTTPEFAALANGAAVRLLDFNDHTLGGHPSDNMAAILAAAEQVGASFDDVVSAIVVNYEVFGELGRLLVRDGGWDQGCTGVIASACATGRVLGLDVQKLANAIGIAAISTISTRKSRRGSLTMWKGMATPYAAQSGLLAASMAGSGVTGPLDAFAGENGFWEQIHGPFELCELTDPTSPVHLFRANYKYWPVEFNAQAAVWLGRAVRDVVDVEQIASVKVETYHWAWHEIGKEPEKWAPTTRETADHSLPYVLAVSLRHGAVDLGHFRAVAIADPVTLDLMSRIRVVPADDLTAGFPDQYLMRADVTTIDGHRHHVEVGEPRGRYTNPMTDQDVETKFRRLARHSSSAGRAEEILAAVWALREGGHLSRLLDTLTTRTTPDPVA